MLAEVKGAVWSALEHRGYMLVRVRGTNCYYGIRQAVLDFHLPPFIACGTVSFSVTEHFYQVIFLVF